MRFIYILLMLSNFLLAKQVLGTIVVTTKSNQALENTPSSFTIISAKDIENMSQNSIEGILQSAVGIMPTVNDSSVFGRKALSIRGMKSDHILILLNGRWISGTDKQIGHSNFQYNWVPIESIEKIEVIRGPLSSIYGSKGLGGVINIITKKPKDEISGSLNAETGMMQGSQGGDEYALSADLRGKFDKLGFYFSLEKRKIDITSEQDNKSVTQREGKDIINALLNLDYQIDDTSQINSSIIYGKENRNTIGQDKYYDIKKQHYSLGYKKSFDKLNINLEAYKTSSDSHSGTLNYTHRLEDDIANFEINTDVINNNYIIAGVEYKKEMYHKDYDELKNKKKDFKDDIFYLAGYLQDEISLNDKLFLTLGARYDKHENFGLNLSPKVYLVYAINDDFRLKGGYGKGFNAPTVTQSSNNYEFLNPTAARKFYGNNDLQPETSENFEAGFDYEINNMNFEIMAFYNQIKDLIGLEFVKKIPNPIPNKKDITVSKYSNVSEAKTWGLEMTWKHKNVIKNLDYSLNYTYLGTKDEENDKKLTFRPKHKLNFLANYKFPAKINSSFMYQYIGEQEEDTYDKIAKHDKRIKLSGYSLASLQVSKRFFNSLKFSLGIENLFDEKLSEDYNYQLRRRYYYVRLNYNF